MRGVGLAAAEAALELRGLPRDNSSALVALWQGITERLVTLQASYTDRTVQFRAITELPDMRPVTNSNTSTGKNAYNGCRYRFTVR